MDCAGVVCNILVIDLGKESWELLVLRAAGVEPGNTSCQNR